MDNSLFSCPFLLDSVIKISRISYFMATELRIFKDVIIFDRKLIHINGQRRPFSHLFQGRHVPCDKYQLFNDLQLKYFII